jgi:D-amino-acid dehydrogenase
MDCQTLVLGAGIVGVCSALHLQAAGQSVILLDRDEPGRGTSHGNAGLIERSSIIPYAFPREWSRLLRYGLNQQSSMRFSPVFCHASRPGCCNTGGSLRPTTWPRQAAPCCR